MDQTVLASEQEKLKVEAAEIGDNLEDVKPGSDNAQVTEGVG